MKKRSLRGDRQASTCPLRALWFGCPEMLLVMEWSSVVAPVSLLQLGKSLPSNVKQLVLVLNLPTYGGTMPAFSSACTFCFLSVPSWFSYVGSWFTKAPSLRQLFCFRDEHVLLLVGCGLVGGLR